MTSQTRTNVQQQAVEVEEQPSEGRFAVRLQNCPGHGPVDVILTISTTCQVAECQSCNGRGVVLASIPLEFSRVIVDAEHAGSVIIDAGKNGGRWCFEQVSEMASSEERSSLLDMLASSGALRTDFEHEYRVTRNIRPSTDTQRAQIVFAEQLRGKRCNVAVKITSPNDIHLIREMRALQQLNNHPNIVRMHEAYELQAPTRWAMVMEALNGGNLFQRVKRNGGPLGDFRALQFVEQIFNALSYIHNRDMVHRDVKPENAVLAAENSNQLRLVDFGLATHKGGPEMQKRCGTPGYVAQEVLLGRPYGCNVDCFSAGVVLYFLLTAINPFLSSDGPIVSDVLKSNAKCEISFEQPTLLGCDSLLRQCLQADPTSRCTSRWAVEEAQRLKVACAELDAPPVAVQITYTQDEGNSANPAYCFRVVQGKNGDKLRHFQALDKKLGETKCNPSSDVKAVDPDPSAEQVNLLKDTSSTFTMSTKSTSTSASAPCIRATLEVENERSFNTSSISKRSGETASEHNKSSDIDSLESWNPELWQSNMSGGSSSSSGYNRKPDSPGGDSAGDPTGPDLRTNKVGRRVSGTSSSRKSACFEMFMQRDGASK